MSGIVGSLSGSIANSWTTGLTGSLIVARPGGDRGYAVTGENFGSESFGTDVNVFLSGTVDGKGKSGTSAYGVTAIGGDLVTSGAFNLERMSAPGTTTDKLYNVGGTLTWAGSALAAGGTPGGSDTQVQYNDGSSFAGMAGLTFTKTTGVLLLTGSSKLNFRDTGMYIQGSDDGNLDVKSDRLLSLTGSSSGGGGGVFIFAGHGSDSLTLSGTSINIESFSQTLQIQATGSNSSKIQMTSSGSIEIASIGDGTDCDVYIGGGNLSLGSNKRTSNVFIGTVGDAAPTEIDLSATTIDINGASVVDINAQAGSASAIIMSASHAGGGINIDAGTAGITIDCDDAISIDAAAASNFTTTSGALTLAGVSLDIDASAGAIAIDAAGAGNDIVVDSAAGSVYVRAAEAASDAIVLDAESASGGIDLSVGSTVKVSLDTNSLDVTSGVTVNVDDTTDSTSTSTGALIVDGGVGIAKNLYVGGDAVLGNASTDTVWIKGNLFVSGTTTAISSSNLVVKDPVMALNVASGTVGGLHQLYPGPAGDIGIVMPMTGASEGSPVFFWDHSSISSGVPSGNFVLGYADSTGSSGVGESITPLGYLDLKCGNVVVPNDSGIGSAGDTNAITISSAGQVDVTATTNATTTTDGALALAGGLSIAATKDLVAGNDVHLLTDSAVLSLGAGKDVKITHDGTDGATMDSAGSMTIQVTGNDKTLIISGSAGTGTDGGIYLRPGGTEQYTNFTRFVRGDAGASVFAEFNPAAQANFPNAVDADSGTSYISGSFEFSGDGNNASLLAPYGNILLELSGGYGNSAYLRLGAHATQVHSRTDFVVDGTKRLYLNDVGGEYLSSDGSDLTITAGGDLIFAPSGGDVLPDADNTRNLGSASRRWANVFTGDLHLKNDRGDWTMVEEDEYLSITNNKSGKKYRLLMEEVDDDPTSPEDSEVTLNDPPPKSKKKRSL
jgi:hypothetical protein